MASYTDLMMKLARQERLNASETEDLQKYSQDLEHMGSFLNGVKSNGRVSPNAIEGFSLPDTSRLRRLASQSIPNNTNTLIEFDTFTGGNAIQWIESAPTEIRRNVLGTVGIMGQVEFDGNATGYRAAFLDAYKGATSLGGSNLATMSPSGYTTDVLNFALCIRLTTYDQTHFTLKVYQNSGGALNVTYASISVFNL